MIESARTLCLSHLRQEETMKETLIDWLGTFWKVLTLPTPKTFLAEAKKADGKFASAIGWLVFYAVYIYTLASLAFGRLLAVSTLLTVMLVVPLAVLLFTSAAHFICQRLLRRKEYLYDKMLYLTVAILLPVFLIIAPLSLFLSGGVFQLLAFILLFYQVALLTIAIKTTADIEYWQALVTVFLSIVVGILVGGIIFILIRATVAPPGINNSK
jgi:hypothetical protein